MSTECRVTELEVKFEALNNGVADLARKYDRLRRDHPGTPGTGACICKNRPDRNRDPHGIGRQTDDLNSILDHRCPLHGEKAQPALWGRHKDFELCVTPAEWDSLGVRYEVKT